MNFPPPVLRPARRLVGPLVLAVLLVLVPRPGDLFAQNLVALEREGFPMAFQNGRRVVTFEERPVRVLALGLEAAELLAELGLADMLVGAALQSPRQTPLPRYAPALSRVPSVSLDDLPDLELAADGPDFLFGRMSPDLREPAFLKSYHTLAGNKDQFFQEVRDLARILDAEEKAADFIASQNDRLSDVSRRLAKADRVPVLFVRRFQDGTVRTYGGPDFPTSLLALAGAENVLGHLGSEPEVHFSEAWRRKPEAVFLVDDGREPPEERLAALKDDPDFAGLPAVREGRLYHIAEAYLLPGPRLADAVEIMAASLHPSLRP
ncbi:MAG: ABC transporter substrate-binding protein [Deltaproteobacteria bacterium]|jgi:iron complex transport system substrate-binding protein|nr:ABC transporter substrate-binding protein [Deltaproteobacteria bacterium]